MLKMKWCVGAAFLFVGCGGVCGDGAIDKGEACDDGATDVFDGCDAVCAIEPSRVFILPPDDSQARVDLTEQWFQWALEAPRDASPLFDTTGEFSDVGQVPGIFFLAGNTGGAVTRAATVPANTPIFFPIINGVFVTFPGIDPAFNAVADICAGDVAVSCTVATQAVDCASVGDLCITGEVNARNAIAMDGTEVLTLELDGEVITTDQSNTAQSLLDFQTVSDVFSAEMPDFNFFDGADPLTENFCQNQTCADAVAAGQVGNSAGTYPDNVSDGYWIQIAPLPAGAHTLNFTGSKNFGGFLFELDVTYNLTVE